MRIVELDKVRYNGGNMPLFQKYYRKSQERHCMVLGIIYRCLFAHYKRKFHIEIYYRTQIGEGLYIGHPYGITINLKAIIGKNCNIHKGVTIGQENRGSRKGTPIIGDNVWIGVNSTIVGNVKIGDDVLIAPNSFVNRDIPSHSVVVGNPCVIKHRDYATEGYINHTV